MARRQRDNWTRRLVKNGSAPTTERVGAARARGVRTLHRSRRCAGIEDLDLQPDARAAASHVFRRGFGTSDWFGIDQHGRRELARAPARCSSSSRFAVNSPTERIDPGHVAARPGEAGDEAEPHRVVADDEDDRDRRGCRLGRQRRRRCRSRRSRRPAGEPIRPPAPAADHVDSSAQRYSIATFWPST